MTTVNMREAKSNLSRLVEAVENGDEEEIVIARNGKPAAKLVPIARKPIGKGIGAAQGVFKAPAPDKKLDAQIAKLFTGK